MYGRTEKANCEWILVGPCNGVGRGELNAFPIKAETGCQGCIAYRLLMPYFQEKLRTFK